MTRRICVVTSGHLSTCPRMLKAADAFHDAGYDVRMVSTNSVPWATAADRAVRDVRRWRWRVVDFDAHSARRQWLTSGARRRAAWALATLGPSLAPASLAVSAVSRVHRELMEAILEEPADLIYGGTIGAVAAVAGAARRSSIPFGIDFEDFHAGEHADIGAGAVHNALAGSIMREAAGCATFVTAGSGAIAEACRRFLQRAVEPIHNVFPLPSSPPPVRSASRAPLKLYWFSQTIGPSRGLEDVVRAVGFAQVSARLDLRGCPVNGYVESLRTLAADCAPRLEISVLAPIAPDQMIASCAEYDIGVCAEQPVTQNRALSLENKAGTYVLAGLPVAVTDTAGHREFAADLSEGALTFAAGDAASLADRLARLSADRAAMEAARESSWTAARQRWHWEHELERGRLLALAASAVS